MLGRVVGSTGRLLRGLGVVAMGEFTRIWGLLGFGLSGLVGVFGSWLNCLALMQSY